MSIENFAENLATAFVLSELQTNLIFGVFLMEVMAKYLF